MHENVEGKTLRWLGSKCHSDFATSQKLVMVSKMISSEAATIEPEHIGDALYGCRERADAAERQKKTVTGLADTVRHAEDALNANFDKCTSLVSFLSYRGSSLPAQLCCTAPIAPV